MSQDIAEFVNQRGITEVLHFTTNHGLIGVVASGAVLSRDDLKAEALLSDVHLLNCTVRRDEDWTGYVNLSIAAVNKDFLVSSKGWHPPRDGVWWAVLSFSPDLLSDPGVVFATTNNVYHSVVRRAEGLAGLEALYADAVPWGYYGKVAYRSVTMPPDRPTHVQAEVLYPGRVPLQHLKAIYVPEEERLDDVAGLLTALTGAPNVPVAVRPEVFL